MPPPSLYIRCICTRILEWSQQGNPRRTVLRTAGRPARRLNPARAEGRQGDAQPEVQAVMQSRLTPGYVRNALNPAFKAALPQACTASAARFCPGMPASGGRVLACLYAYSDHIPKTCSDAAQAALRQGQ